MTIGEYMKDILGEAPAVLCHRIFAILKSKISQFQEAEAYSDNQDGKLFDLSNRLAELFLEYRQLDKDTIFDVESPHAFWEKKLYDELFPTKPEIKKNDGSKEFYFGPEHLTPLQKCVLQETGCTTILYEEAETAKDIKITAQPYTRCSTSPRVRKPFIYPTPS